MGLTIIMGNMFSGKTSELIRRLKRYKVIGKKIVVINSSKDTRSSEEVLKTHDGVEFSVSESPSHFSLYHKGIFLQRRYCSC
jgi:thymidine kinase